MAKKKPLLYTEVVDANVPGTVLGIDAALNNVGMVLAHPTPHADRPYAIRSWACLHEDPSIKAAAKTRKGWAYMSEVTVRRVAHCSRHITAYMNTGDVRYMVVEFPSGGSKSNAAARALAMITAIIATIAEQRRIEVLPVSAMDAKELFQRVGLEASKDNVAAGGKAMYPDISWPAAKCDYEHILDALGALIAAKDDPAMHMACCVADF